MSGQHPERQSTLRSRPRSQAKQRNVHPAHSKCEHELIRREANHVMVVGYDVVKDFSVTSDGSAPLHEHLAQKTGLEGLYRRHVNVIGKAHEVR